VTVAAASANPDGSSSTTGEPSLVSLGERSCSRSHARRAGLRVALVHDGAALSALYVHFNGLSWMRGAFHGIGAAVIAIIARSVVKLVKMTLSKDYVLWSLFLASAVVTAWTESEICLATLGVILRFKKAREPLVILAAGVVGLVVTQVPGLPGWGWP
jgi:hypothetical protein